MNCVIDAICVKSEPAYIIDEDDNYIAFLDHRPLFPGHTLLAPKAHIETFADLPIPLIAPLFERCQVLAKAIVAATKAQGSFIAMNNKISQSIPHLHIHIVPRTKGDGLKGFFWPRQSYADKSAMEAMQQAIQHYLGKNPSQ